MVVGARIGDASDPFHDTSVRCVGTMTVRNGSFDDVTKLSGTVQAARGGLVPLIRIRRRSPPDGERAEVVDGVTSSRTGASPRRRARRGGAGRRWR